MSLYPSLEDMKVDQMVKAQLKQMPTHQSYVHPPPAYPGGASAPAYPSTASRALTDSKYATLYPTLDNYMGLQIQPQQQAVQQRTSTPNIGNMVAPISGGSAGLVRAQVHHGLREVTLCKDGNGKIGLRVQPINKGVFVIVVQKNSPAALVGLRFGDQILMINDVTVAGYSMDDVHKLIKKANPEKMTMVIRDRPFERTVTVHKDSFGNYGFGFKNGKIINIVKDSSAARNGMLTDHNILEVNGQNVVGLKDKEITSLMKEGPSPVTLTIMPSFVYDHMIKHTASSFIKKTMDHSIPDI